MIDRRSLIALSAAAPFARSPEQLDVPDPRIHPLNTGGIRVIGISPDASLLLGMRDHNAICILDGTTREVVAESDVVPDLGLLDIPAIAWSPDGSHIAMSTRPWGIEYATALYVMDVASGDVTNLTADESNSTDEPQLDGEEAPVDANPIWLDNDRLLFSRNDYLESQESLTTLSVRSLQDGTVETWVDLSARDVLFVMSRIWQRADGSLVFGADVRRNDRTSSVALIVSPDGEIEEIDLSALGRTQVIDVNETHLIAMDVAAFAYWYVPLDSPEDAVELWDYFDLPGTFGMRSEVVFGPEPDTVLVVAENEKDQTFVLQLSGLETTEIAELYRADRGMTVHWTEDVILVTSEDPAWLILPEN